MLVALQHNEVDVELPSILSLNLTAVQRIRVLTSQHGRFCERADSLS